MSAAISRASRRAAGEKSTPGHPGAEPGPGQRVDAEVALEMEQRPAADVADRRDLLVEQPDAAGAEPGEVVEVAFGVDRGPGLPQPLVRRERFRVIAQLGRSLPGSAIRATRGRRRPAPDPPSGRTGRGRRSARGSRASPRAPVRPTSSSMRAIQPPATPSSVRSGIAATAEIQVGSTRSMLRSLLGSPLVVRAAAELVARVDEVDRGVALRGGAGGLGEVVEPGRVHAAAQREVRAEPFGVAAGRPGRPCRRRRGSPARRRPRAPSAIP